MPDFFFSARNVRKGRFGAEPDKTSYLFVPDGVTEPLPSHKTTRKAWVEALMEEAKTDGGAGHILIFIHGFKNSPESVLRRHRHLKNRLAGHGYQGAVASFDWPSGNLSLGYLEDRTDAKKSAILLTTDGVAVLSAHQLPDCLIHVHLLAHSMGAFVTREAFDDADDRLLPNQAWLINQVFLIGGDISRGSMSASDATTASLYRHCARLTNYSNRHDSALAVSNVKRVGVAPRVGRHGLPSDAPSKAVNVDCSDYWKRTRGEGDDLSRHSWHFEDDTLTRDMFLTMMGIDRESVDTREMRDGQIVLR